MRGAILLIVAPAGSLVNAGVANVEAARNMIGSLPPQPAVRAARHADAIAISSPVHFARTRLANQAPC